MWAGDEVLMEVDDNGAMIVGGPEWILGQRLTPHQTYLLNIIFNV